MESPQKKAGSMDGSKTPHLLPVPWSLGFMDFPEKKAGSMDPVTVARKTPRPIDVRAWAILSAGATAFSLAVGYSIAHTHALDHFHVPCTQISFLPCETDAEEAAVNAIWFGVLSGVLTCLAPGAVLALRPLCRRRWVRRVLTCLALAVTVIGHCLYATAGWLFLVARPGDLYIGMCCILGIFFIPISFLPVLLGGEE